MKVQIHFKKIKEKDKGSTTMPDRKLNRRVQGQMLSARKVKRGKSMQRKG